MEKSFTKTISSLLLIMMVVIPIFSLAPSKAEAADSLSSYITNLSPVITRMPGCTKAIGTGITDLFNAVKNLFSSKQSKINAKAEAAMNAQVQEGVVKTSDPLTQQYLLEVKAKQDEAAKSQANIDKNQNCLNAIGKAVAKVLINRITDSTINWINTGYAGDPLYIQNPGSFFGNIAKDEFLGIAGEINDPTKYPFGKDFLQAEKNVFASKFANNAQYSLNQMIQDQNPGLGYSAQGFSGDFSQGGWGAWDAMTQNPANNPLGFALMASNELGKRIENQTNLVQGSLQQSGGFLGVQQCTNPKGMTKQEDETNRVFNASNPGSDKLPTCGNNWEIVTPGKLVAEKLTGAVNMKDNALLNVQTLNDAMGAILDAVLAKFSSDVESNSKGLAGTTQGNPYDSYSDVTGIGNFQTGNDYSDAQLNDSTWLADHPDFNIRTDLNQALIDEQRIYQDKLKEQNDALIVQGGPVTDKSPLGNSGLIPTIYQLDYCIPGPHPGWEGDTRDALDKAESKVANTEGMDFTQVASATGHTDNVGIELTLVAKALGVADTDTIDMVAKMLGTGTAHCGAGASVTDCVNRYYFKDVIADFTNIGLYDHDDNFQTYSQTMNILDTIYDGYVKAIHNTYILDILPTAAQEAKTEFNKIPDFYDTIAGNQKTIDALTSTITRLNEIKAKIDDLNDQLTNKTLKTKDATGNEIVAPDQQAAYEEDIIPWKDAFATLSSSMYSGDDIATIDTATKKIVAETDYDYNNLIKGDTGCENQLANPIVAFPQQLSPGYMVNRPDYPLPILYKYPDQNPYGTPDRKGFLYYGSYANWTNTPRTSWNGDVDDYNATINLCKFYIPYGTSTEAQCNAGSAGADYIPITHWLNFEGGFTKTLGVGIKDSQGVETYYSPFESKLGIY
jgi:hypothetical protein